MNSQSRSVLRQQILAQRNEMTVSEVFEKSRNIFRNLSELIPPNSVSFHSFIGSIQKREVNTITFLAELIRKEKLVWVPFIDNEKIMHSSRLESLEDLEEAPFGLLQPKNIKDSERKNFDVILIPGLKFDRKGNRLGYGKGYYDKFLSVLKDDDCMKIGICFDFQLGGEIKAETWDIKMDYVVTDDTILKIDSDIK